MLQRPLQFNKEVLKQYIQPGDTVIDATAGNGHDTVFLAQLVGKTGHVVSFDIQRQAIEETQKKLLLTGLLPRVTLHQTGHENIEKTLGKITIQAAVFNLGYLPKGDKKIVTVPETTIAAIKQCLNLCQPGSVVSLMVYFGHDGGPEEKAQVLKFVRELPQQQFTVYQYQIINQINTPPFLLIIEKK